MKKEILSLGKNSIVYGVGSVITRFVGLVTLPFFTARLAPEEYGVLAMLAMLTMVMQPVFSLGLSAAMGPSYFENGDICTKSKTVWSAFSINCGSAFALIFLAWVTPAYLGGLVRIPAAYSSLVSLSLTGTALTILATPFSQRVQFEKQALLYVSITAVTALSAIVVSVYTVLVLGFGVEGMVYGQVAGNLIMFISFISVGLKNTVPMISVSVAKSLLRLGLPLVPSFAFLFVLIHANKYILEWRFGLDAVGLYSIGFSIGMAISIVTSGVASAWYPFFMSYIGRQDQAKPVFRQIATYYFFTVGLVCSAFFLFAKPVVYFLTDVKYHPAHAIVGFVALANFSQTLFNLLLPGVYYNKAMKSVSAVQCLAAILSLPLSYILIQAYSVLGAAIGLFLGNLAMAGLLYAWNSINRSTYIVVDYDWRRISLIVLMFFFVVFIYYCTPEGRLGVEVVKSMAFFVASSFCVYILLSKEERFGIHEKLHNTFSRGVKFS